MSFARVPMDTKRDSIAHVPETLGGSGRLPSIPYLNTTTPPRTVATGLGLLSLFVAGPPYSFLVLLANMSMGAFAPTLSTTSRDARAARTTIYRVKCTLPSYSLVGDGPVSQGVTSIFFKMCFSATKHAGSRTSGWFSTATSGFGVLRLPLPIADVFFDAFKFFSGAMASVSNLFYFGTATGTVPRTPPPVATARVVCSSPTFGLRFTWHATPTRDITTQFSTSLSRGL